MKEKFKKFKVLAVWKTQLQMPSGKRGKSGPVVPVHPQSKSELDIAELVSDEKSSQIERAKTPLARAKELAAVVRRTSKLCPALMRISKRANRAWEELDLTGQMAELLSYRHQSATTHQEPKWSMMFLMTRNPSVLLVVSTDSIFAFFVTYSLFRNRISIFF